MDFWQLYIIVSKLHTHTHTHTHAHTHTHTHTYTHTYTYTNTHASGRRGQICGYWKLSVSRRNQAAPFLNLKNCRKFFRINIDSICLNISVVIPYVIIMF